MTSIRAIFDGKTFVPQEPVSLPMQTQAVVLVEAVNYLPESNWVDKAIKLDATGKREESLDVIFDNLDELLLSSKFDECNTAIATMAQERLTNAQLLTVLTATAAAKDRLSARKAFYDRTAEVLHASGADATELLVGLQ